MIRMIILLIVSMLACGCAKLAHLDELLTLKALSDNQEQQQKYVEAHNKKFEALLEAVKNNSLGNYPNKKDFLKKFGEPILAKHVVRDGKEYEECFYRYATKLSGSERIYLYFDSEEKLVDYQHILPDEGTESVKVAVQSESQAVGN